MRGDSRSLSLPLRPSGQLLSRTPWPLLALKDSQIAATRSPVKGVGGGPSLGRRIKHEGPPVW
ncbi:hypothetical protein E2C01_087722 [Portunus trituberculatus]|uniref:Uncharacterized protein n=1 Tax=Portunus trituberculatus TaxID=210409 RepID=A0A5B7J8X7_PORTR|nr:hypothetical protein [Portunus trituberculatus]